MFHSKTQLLTPIAAALAMALVAGGAVAASPNSVNQQSTSNSNHQQSWNNTNQQSNANMNGQAWNSMSPQSKDAYREGEIWASYVLNPELQAYKIKDNVQGNKVTLTGTVNSKYDKWLAQHIAQHVNGITTVANEIKVNPAHAVVTTFVPASAFAQNVGNATISAEINSQLLWNEYTDGLDVNVAAHNGKVTLTGVADTQKAKRRAGNIAAHTRGVTSVSNQLRFSSDAAVQSSSNLAGATLSGKRNTDDWIKHHIQSSYGFTAGVDPSDINVHVDNRLVTLTGTVDNNIEREKAIDIAQQTVGVKKVKAGGLQVSQDQVAMNN